MKKKLIILLAFVSLFGATFVLKNKKSNFPQKKEINNKITVYQKIGDKESPSLKMMLGDTALDLLKKTAEIKTKGKGKNTYVVEINGYSTNPKVNKKKEFWSFFINGKIAPVGAGSYQLKDNDKIEWKIKTY